MKPHPASVKHFFFSVRAYVVIDRYFPCCSATLSDCHRLSPLFVPSVCTAARVEAPSFSLFLRACMVISWLLPLSVFKLTRYITSARLGQSCALYQVLAIVTMLHRDLHHRLAILQCCNVVLILPYVEVLVCCQGTRCLLPPAPCWLLVPGVFGRRCIQCNKYMWAGGLHVDTCRHRAVPLFLLAQTSPPSSVGTCGPWRHLQQR